MAFTYEPLEETRDYQPVPSLQWYRQHKVPKVPHHRSMYLHVLQVLLENEYDHERDNPPDIEDAVNRSTWSEIQTKIFRFWLDQRGNDVALSRDHRLLLWQIWARMQFSLQRRDAQLRRAHRLPLVSDFDLAVAKRNVAVRQFTVKQLWRAVFMLLLVWNSLKYSEDVSTYVGALATQCGRYFWITLPSVRIFNHPSCVEMVPLPEDASVAGPRVRGNDVDNNTNNTGNANDNNNTTTTSRRRGGARPARAAPSRAPRCWRVNTYFKVEMERMFFGMLQQLDQHATLISTAVTVHIAQPPSSYQAIADWLGSALEKDAVRELVDILFEKEIYARRALVGEIERFAEDDQHAKADAQNAISRWRPQVIDETSDLLADDGLADKLLALIPARDRRRASAESAESAVSSSSSNRRLGDRPDAAEAEAESDADELAIITAGYMLDEAFANQQISFSTWFVCHHVPVPRSKHRYPVLVKACNAWHVSHEGSVWLCDDATTAIDCWIRRLCATEIAFEDIKHVAPRREPFYEAHRGITGGEVSAQETVDIATRVRSEAANALLMPDSYGGR